MNRIVLTILVVVHMIAAAWHGQAHTDLAIVLPPLKNTFVYVVIVAAPLLGAGLLWTRHAALGGWILAASMTGALLFGAYHHYVLVSPDNIEHLPEGTPHAHAQFINSAAVIALLELATALAAAFASGSGLRRTDR